MANFSITISNSLNAFQEADKWNSFNWNAFKWGQGTADLETRVTKIIDTGSITPDTDIIKLLSRQIDNTLSLDADMYSETLMDGSGYRYVFPSNTTDAESRNVSVYSSAAVATSTWSSATLASVTWS